MLASQNVKNKLKNSEVVEIDEKSLIDVSSSEGRGGVAIVWSENLTKFSGSIIAKGGEKNKSINKKQPQTSLIKLTSTSDPLVKKAAGRSKDPHL